MMKKTRIDELSVDKLKAYKDAAKSPEALRTRPLMKLSKSVEGNAKATAKIKAKTGDRRNPRDRYGEIGKSSVYEDVTNSFDVLLEFIQSR